MNTAQLVVVSYAAVAVEGVLLWRALVEGSAAALILAILVLAAFLVYFLKPHPLARKLVVVGAVVLPFAAFAAWYWGWSYYQDWRQAAQAESQAAEWAKANIPEEKQRAYRQEFPGRSWADMVGAWQLAQLQQEEAEKARQQQAAKETEQRARVAARLKVGDRVWVLSDSHAAIEAGVYFAKTPRLFGTVVGTDFPADRGVPPLAGGWLPTDRYSVKLDDALFGRVIWVHRNDLNLVARQ